jgi:hypothetical protein
LNTNLFDDVGSPVLQRKHTLAPQEKRWALLGSVRRMTLRDVTLSFEYELQFLFRGFDVVRD